MAETLVEERRFGDTFYGTGTDTVSGVKRKWLWKVNAAYAGYFTAIDFTVGNYWNAGINGAISGFPGYFYSDNVDNQPNITAAGYQGVASELPIFRFNTPFNTEQDFIIYGTYQFPAATLGANEWLFALTDGGGALNNVIALERAFDGSMHAFSASGGVQTDIPAGVTITNQPFGVIIRRRATKMTLGLRVSGTTTFSAESAATTFPVGLIRTAIGSFDGAGTGAPSPSFLQCNLFIQSGTFSDSDLQNKLNVMIA